YTVTYTTAGTCPNSSTASVTINALDDASFNYSAAAYCVDASDPTPTITGLTGGTFSSTLGLSLTAGTGQIDVSASTPGTYTVTYTTAGTCPNSSTASVTINALDDASFNYSAAAYCVDASDPTPTITGLTGGTFSSTLGLSITAGTGLIDVSTSTPGTYTVTYTTAGTCPNSSTASVTINALDDASFNYSAAAYCVDAIDPTPTITGLTGGTFSSTLGLSITAGTGLIDVSASTPGTYTVTYTTAGTCPNSSTASVTINALDDASFNYSAAAYCVDAIDPTPTITGLTGGTFSSTLGLSITAGTGLIDVSASTPGTYTVTYTTAGTCPNNSTASVTINALDDASFNYSAAAYCVDAIDPTPTITGLTGGTFSSTLGLSITAGTGLIDVSTSTPGTYTVTYTTAGTCPNSSTASVTINALDDASFNYSAAAYCVDAIDPTPAITGLTGGTFSSTLGLSLTAGTGLIDVSASTPGTYTVTYTTAGTCPNSSTASVTINALDDASFNYSAAAYCVDASDPTPTITGLTGGTFSSTLGLSITAGTGLIDVSTSTPGTYTVTYTTAGTCPNSSTASVTINALDDASFNYSAAAYCVDAIDPTPTITGLTGGTFSSTLGLSITAGTGLIDVSTSTPGTYTVTYTTAGTCPNSSTASVTINALDDASFNYSAAAYCVDAIDPTPTITGLTGGTFSSTLGLSLTAGTGLIDVSTSTPGTYTVTYTTAGTCPNSSTASVTINALDDASFNYSAAAYCVDAIDPTPTITGLTGGTFSSTLGLSLTAGTGLIDVSTSTPGTYTVTYTTAGTCPNSSTASVTINALDDASFNYSAAAYCVDAIDPTPTITGLTGGTFSSTLGLSITAGTGLIDVSTSTPGTYTVTYTTAGTCPNSSTA
ncbi:beta strand repeat-containing protein, partial [Flavivirga jejuensis]